MFCPYCGADSHVTDSRPGRSLTIIRKRQCLDNPKHRFLSREIYENCFSTAKRRVNMYAETVRRRIGIFERDRDIFHSWKEGVAVLMDRYGLCKSSLWLARWRHEDQLGIPRTKRRTEKATVLQIKDRYDHTSIQAPRTQDQNLARAVSSTARR